MLGRYLFYFEFLLTLLSQFCLDNTFIFFQHCSLWIRKHEIILNWNVFLVTFIIWKNFRFLLSTLLTNLFKEKYYRLMRLITVCKFIFYLSKLTVSKVRWFYKFPYIIQTRFSNTSIIKMFVKLIIWRMSIYMFARVR